MQNYDFEKIVKEGIESIPAKFLEKLENVNICIDNYPTKEQMRKLRAKKGVIVFGLYEGVPQTKRTNYGQVLPDKITIFKKPIENAAKSEKGIKEIVKNTVWHEIAHHFGMSEEQVKAAEKKRS